MKAVVNSYLDENALKEISEQQRLVTKKLLSDNIDIKLAAEISNSNGKRLKAEALKLTHAMFKNMVTYRGDKTGAEAERLISLANETNS